MNFQVFFKIGKKGTRSPRSTFAMSRAYGKPGHSQYIYMSSCCSGQTPLQAKTSSQTACIETPMKVQVTKGNFCQQHKSVCAQVTLKIIVDRRSRRPECLHVTLTSIYRAIIPNALLVCMARVACMHTVIGEVIQALSLTCSPSVCKMCDISAHKSTCQLAEASQSL